jgi:hypothetical protein
MRKLIILLLVTSHACAQKAMVSADKMNEVYIGYVNPISIAANGFLTRDLVLKSRIGKLEKKAPGKYIFSICGAAPANLFFYVYVKKQQFLHLVDSVNYRIKSAPLPIVRIGPSHNGRIQKNLLLAQEQLGSSDDNDFADGPRHSIQRFELELHRQNGDTLLLKSSTGNITGEMKTAFKTMGPTDWFILKNTMFYNKCEGARMAADSGIFTVYE